MKILVINCGSSSIKYQLFDTDIKDSLAEGIIDRVGAQDSSTTHKINGEKIVRNDPILDYEAGIRQILDLMTSAGSPPPIKDASEIDGVGHRVVHGAEKFVESVVLNEEVLSVVEDCVSLAPLHNPANLGGIRATMAALPGKPQVGVFDTAFFQTMPPEAYMYTVPYEWYEKHRVRRYGFHGTSHRYICMQAAELLGKPAPNLITLHLGNGCSMTCIKGGKAIDQTMGLTPLEGLVMGTRSGDIDPAIIFHMISLGMNVDEVRASLEKKSGVKGISGLSNDMRDVEDAAVDGHERAKLALDIYAHRIKKYLGAFLAELGTCDGICYTGGVGEKSFIIREMVSKGLEPLGIELDYAKNDNFKAKEPICLSTPSSKIPIWVIPTNEELMIAMDTEKLIK